MFKNIVITINKDGSIYIERTDDRGQYIKLDNRGLKTIVQNAYILKCKAGEIDES